MSPRLFGTIIVADRLGVARDIGSGRYGRRLGGGAGREERNATKRAAERDTSTESGRVDYSVAGCSLARCAVSSSSSAQPARYKLTISNVRSVGLPPVHSVISRQAIIAQYAWI
jgi:hypothetical protein